MANGKSDLDVLRDLLGVDVPSGILQDGIRKLAQAGDDELKQFVPEDKIGTIRAAFELGRRWSCKKLEPGKTCEGPQDVYEHFLPILRDEQREHLHLVLLDHQMRVIKDILVSTGTLNSVAAPPADVFRHAIRHCATRVCLVHNHPGVGKPTPSQADISLTMRMILCGELLGIEVMDHLVISEGGYASIRSIIGDKANNLAQQLGL